MTANSASRVTLTYQNEIPYKERISVTSAADVHEFLTSEVYDPLTIEHRLFVKVIFVNTECKVLGYMDVAEGGLQNCPVDIRPILQAAILSNAYGIIISHNAPCGNIEPSDSDKAFSTTIGEALKYHDIKYLDFVIVSKDKHFSFSDEYLIK
ncbi:MAG: DNA repair protein [Prevotella sp.]|jgi:DNA repair protein RadC|nr:DNA repair protein [Prevotella sp.]